MGWTRRVVLQPVCQPDRRAWLQEIEQIGSCGSKMSTSLALREELLLVKRFRQTIDTAFCLAYF